MEAFTNCTVVVFFVSFIINKNIVDFVCYQQIDGWRTKTAENEKLSSENCWKTDCDFYSKLWQASVVLDDTNELPTS